MNTTGNSTETAKKVIGRPFKRGESGNPSGRPKLPEEVRIMKDEALQKAIELFHSRVTDEVFMSDLEPAEFLRFMEVAYDRFGLPKTTRTKSELSGSMSLEDLVIASYKPLDESENTPSTPV